LRDVFVVVAALAHLGAQVFSTLHYVLVPHHLCAVHGVLEDGDHSVDAAHATPADPVSVDVREEESHDECSVATRHEDGVLLARPALAAAQLIQAADPAVSQGISLKPNRAALLSNAPKTSPPLCA